jgi:hypothetical protein
VKVAAVVALAGLLAAAATAPVAGAEGGAKPADDRSTERIRLDCASDLGRREITLFANGTVRLRQGPTGREKMALGELGPDELASFVAEAAAIDLAESDSDESGLVGPAVERCTVAMTLPGRPLWARRFGRFDTLAPSLARLVGLVDGLAARAEQTSPLREGPGLAPGYQARPGDVLARNDGVLFEVVADTADGRGVELRGIDQPLTVYVAKGQIGREFGRLVKEGRR